MPLSEAHRVNKEVLSPVTPDCRVMPGASWRSEHKLIQHIKSLQRQWLKDLSEQNRTRALGLPFMLEKNTGIQPVPILCLMVVEQSRMVMLFADKQRNPTETETNSSWQ